MIHVVGGTYLEDCQEPRWFELYGSGLRAAVALAQLKIATKFTTFIGVDQLQVLQAKAAHVDLVTQNVPSTIRFEWLHPLAKPIILPESVLKEFTRAPLQCEIDSEKVVRFGLVEGTARVNAKMAVYDPQSPGDPEPFEKNGSVAERLAIIANSAEAERLSGESEAEAACLALLRRGAEVAVVKCGAYGCWVGHHGNATRVPAFRTGRVFPIGSGDVFTAVFAYAWMERGLEPVEAATLASQGTAHYVETRLVPDQDALANSKRAILKPLADDGRKQVYLAAPFFNLPQRWLVEEFQSAFQQANIKVFSPVHDVGPGDAKSVYKPDIDGLKACDVMLACLDGLDSGTIYEVGYAHCLGRRVIAFASAEREEDLKMPIGGGCEMADDFATAFYLTVWAATCE